MLATGADEVAVTVALAGHMEPIDGKYHWYGRITADDAVTALKAAAGRRDVMLAVPGREPVPAKLAEQDPWGNVRITGVGPPPYGLETLADIEG